MALSRSYVRCSLCQGNVSIIAGNLDKLKSHLQNQHEVFHHLDFQIATNFLEDFEKDDLITKLLPRMKVVFEAAKVPGKRRKDENEMKVEAKKERTEEDLNRDEEKEENNIYEDSSDDNFEIVADENPDGQDKTPKSSQDQKGENVQEGSLKAEKGEDKDNVEDIQDDGKEDCIAGSKKEEDNGVKIPSKSEITRKSQRKSIPSRKVFKMMKTPTPRKESVVVAAKNNNNFRTAVSLCPCCQKEMLKRNLRRHLRVVHGQEPPSPPEHQLLLFKCKICGAGFASRDDLGLHTSDVHTLDIEDVEAITVTEDNHVLRDEINIEVIENSEGHGSVKAKLRRGK